MIILDQNLTDVTHSYPVIWDQCGSFNWQSKTQQIAHVIKQARLPQNKILIISDVLASATHINRSDVDLVVINFSDHAYNYFDPGALTKPYVILHWDFANVHQHHPYHLVYSHLVSQDDLVDFITPRTHLVSCVNGKPRLTRIYAMSQLAKIAGYTAMLKTWRKISDCNPVPDWEFDQMSMADLSESEWHEFYQLQTLLSDTAILTEELYCASIGNGFTNAYMNFVTESSCEHNGFLTEKIYKPIRAGQLFVVQGPPGAVQFLRSVGFDTFDDHIDHEYYDHESSWRTRTELAVSVLSDIQPHIADIWHQTTERRIHNAHLLRSPDIMKKCLSAFNANL